MWSFYKLMRLTSVQASGATFGNFLTKEGKTEQVAAGNLFSLFGKWRFAEKRESEWVRVRIWWGQLSSPGSV